MLFIGFIMAAATAIVNPMDVIVPLETFGEEGNGISTGFMIDDTHMITAAHSVGRLKNTMVAICGTKKILIDNKKIALDPELDVAVITLNEKCSQKPIKLAKANPVPGDELYAIGCPGGLENCGMLTKGILSMMQMSPDGLRMISDMKIWYGNSGGPVINSRGELVGIVIEFKNMSRIGTTRLGVVSEVIAQNYSVIVPVSEIISFLKKNL